MLDDPLTAIYAKVQAQQEAEARKIAAIAAHIGHNGGPRIEAPFGIDAPWLRYADDAELSRLATLEPRIERKRLILADTIAERTRIMNRCIRRMRRAAGKD
ncbi:hypothetical protein TM1040_0791 [Ruegeria sp. TM1040]|uniref:hypothetical protein n=1 Tax=Ruegeria sp. (strain TM1040) TaxID=292414 RepID=UPI0000462669|nr:hypothetical protein [Ruegeria sp. TM1040]ABF63524.1 hypothetical protein TM1040_0791 [Ruegeria sp. TM1040]